MRSQTRSNTGDTYEGGQVEYGLGDSLSNSFRGLSSRMERNFGGRDRFADVEGSRRSADMNRQIIKYPRYVVRR